MSNVIKSSRVTVLEEDMISIAVDNSYGKNIPEEIMAVESNIEPVVLSNEEVTENAKYIIEVAESKANVIISDARGTANEIINQSVLEAQNKAIAIKEEAQKEGYDKGYNEAIVEVDRLKQKAQQVVEDAYKQKEEIIASAEPEVMNMILNITYKILGDSLNINPQIILLLIKKGLSQTTTNDNVIVHVSDEEYSIVQSNIGELERYVGGGMKIDVYRDISLKKGDCIIETPFGNIDSSLDLQFEGIKSELLYILNS